MDDTLFYEWLCKKYQIATSKSRLANCRKVEKHEGSLDEHFRKNKGESLIRKLTYTKDDERNKRKKKHNIPIKGSKKDSIYKGTSTLKQAVRLYFDFKSGKKNDKATIITRRATNIRKKKVDWPIWEHPSDQELYELIKLTAKYIKFLHPDIIKELVEDNLKKQNEWSIKLENRNIPAQIYLWDKSPCAFPGVRRYAGSKETAYFRKHTELSANEIKYAVKLDDNDFPKQLWSYIFRNNKFQKYGPKNYALAHLADHKEFNNRLFTEFDIAESANNHQLFGLFTCPTNTAFIPTSLLRLTDFSPIIRKLLINRAQELYGEFCNILPPWLKLIENEEATWKYTDFEWANPVGDIANVKSFIDFRDVTMNSILSK